MVVAPGPGRMIDSFLSTPDAESLPLYSIILKLACVCLSYAYHMYGYHHQVTLSLAERPEESKATR
jgi:hypothetical protein